MSLLTQFYNCESSGGGGSSDVPIYEAPGGILGGGGGIGSPFIAFYNIDGSLATIDNNGASPRDPQHQDYENDISKTPYCSGFVFHNSGPSNTQARHNYRPTMVFQKLDAAGATSAEQGGVIDMHWNVLEIDNVVNWNGHLVVERVNQVKSQNLENVYGNITICKGIDAQPFYPSGSQTVTIDFKKLKFIAGHCYWDWGRYPGSWSVLFNKVNTPMSVVNKVIAGWGFTKFAGLSGGGQSFTFSVNVYGAPFTDINQLDADAQAAIAHLTSRGNTFNFYNF